MGKKRKHSPSPTSSSSSSISSSSEDETSDDEPQHKKHMKSSSKASKKEKKKPKHHRKEKKEKEKKKKRKHKKEAKKDKKKRKKNENNGIGADEEEERRLQKLTERNLQRDVELQAIEDAARTRPVAEQPKSYLRMHDIFAKNAELTVFCHEQTGQHLRDLDTSAASKVFFEFAKLWNANKLDRKYYQGIVSTALEPASRTAYRWKFADQLDPLELASARDAVDTDTNTKSFYELPKEFRKRREGEENPRDQERREKREQRDRAWEEEDPFEQRKRWAAQGKPRLTP